MSGATGSRFPVSLLTGFLGAGKTTLLRRYLTDARAPSTAIVINELGRIGIDQSLVARQHADGAIVELTTGCLCCSAEGDVRATLLGLVGRRRSFEIAQFSRVIIETTGIADPVPVVAALTDSSPIGRFYRPGPIVTVVDAVNGAADLERHSESRRQVQLADRIVISKSDLASDPASRHDLKMLREALARLNPLAVVEDVHDGGFDPLATFAADPTQADLRATRLAGLADDDDGVRSNRSGNHLDGTGAYAFSWTEPMPVAAVEAGLRALVAKFGSRILRAKGLVRTVDRPAEPMVVQLVGVLISPCERLPGWPAGSAASHLVVIAEGVGRAEIAATLGLPVRRPAPPVTELQP